MNIMIDIGHPGHVHLFKHFAHAMIGKGHKVHFTVRDKEFEIELLRHENLSFTNFGRHYKSKSGKMWGLFKFTFLVLKTAMRFKPDLLLSHGSLYNAWASFFLGKPNIALEDTGNQEQVRLYKPFTSTILTSTSFLKKYGKKQIFYDGYHELAYLHPKVFTPDRSVLFDMGVGEGEKYFILRFVSWNASHDVGQGGLSIEEKSGLIDLLKLHGKVFISSEKKLDAEFEQYKFSLPPWRMHDALAFCSLFIGEGATMASECAMLGTPAVYVNSIIAGSVNEQQKYGLLYHFTHSDKVNDKVRELLADNDLKTKTMISRHKMLSEKINLTEFLVWFIENYPGSIASMRKKTGPFKTGL